MIPPVSCIASAWTPDNIGLSPNGHQDVRTPYRLDSYSHAVSAAGGEESCEVRCTVPRGTETQWLAATGGQLNVYDRYAMRVFWGTITTVEVNDGVRARSLTTDGMANAVRVAYTVNGKPQTTARSVTTSSRAYYYTRELVYSAGEMTATEATNTRDRLLQGLAWPFENTVTGLTTRPEVGEASIAIQARGWWHAMTWAAYELKQSAKTGTTNADLVVRNIVNDTLDSPTPNTYGSDLFNIPAESAFAGYSGPSIDTGAGPALGLVFPISHGVELASEAAERILARGDTSGQKLAWGFHLRLLIDRPLTLPIFFARVWAGDAPTTLAYYVRPPGLLLGPHQVALPWTQARPDAMVQVLGGTVDVPKPSTAVDTGGRFWCSRLVYSWQRGSGETLRLEPEGTRDAAAVLSRVR